MKTEKAEAVKRIIQTVCKVNLDLNTRERKYVNARAIGYKILRDNEYMGYKFIAEQFNKTHATIIYSIKEFPYLILSDRQMERDYNKILSIWLSQSDDYKTPDPVQIKKELEYLHDQNKLLNLSLIDVQERCDKKIKELEDRLTEKK